MKNRVKRLEGGESINYSKIMIIIMISDGNTSFDVCIGEDCRGICLVVQNFEMRIVEHFMVPCFGRGTSVKKEPGRSDEFRSIGDLERGIHKSMVNRWSIGLVP